MWMQLLLLVVHLIGVTSPELIEPGPQSGIILRNQPGLLVTNARLHTQKVFVKLNPQDACRKVYQTKSVRTSWAGTSWTMEAVRHAEADITHMLRQIEKFTITQAELGGTTKRSKRFLGGLLAAASAVGTLFNLGMSTANMISISAVKRHVGELQAEMPVIRTQVVEQQKELLALGKTLRGTIVMVNAQSIALNSTIRSVNQLLNVLQSDVAHTQIITSLLNDLMRHTGSSLDSLAMGRIPPYLVPLSLVQSLLTTATQDIVTPLQAHLAYTLGSAVPIYVNPEDREISFLINLPIISAENIYRLKDVVNAGSWQANVHVQIRTPLVVAYHDSNPDLYLAPNLRMCTLTKDIHYLCPSKPFVRDSTDGICGLKAMTANSKCPTKVTTRSRVTETTAEIVGSRWLVNTPLSTATLTYDRHDTSSRVSLPDETFWVDVPVNAILHIGDLALFHLNSDQYETEIEEPEFFAGRLLQLEQATIEQIKYEGSQTIDLAPLDGVIREIEEHPFAAIQPVAYAWSTPDTVLAVTVTLGYIIAIVITIGGVRHFRALRRQFDLCSKNVRNLTNRRQGERAVFRTNRETNGLPTTDNEDVASHAPSEIISLE